MPDVDWESEGVGILIEIVRRLVLQLNGFTKFFTEDSPESPNININIMKNIHENLCDCQ